MFKEILQVRILNSQIHFDSLNTPIMKFKRFRQVFHFSDAEMAYETIKIVNE